jgi:hypothetical protein
MKRPLSVALISGGRTAMDRPLKIGEVKIIVTITAAIAWRVVRRSGKRIAGLI